MQLCFLTERDPRNRGDSFNFFTEWLWERVRHQRLQNITKHTECSKELSAQRKCFSDSEKNIVLWRSDSHQCNVNQLNQPPTGHKSISQILDGLNHVNKLERKRIQGKKKGRYLLRYYFEVLDGVLTSVFLSVITGVHLSLGGKSRSTVYQLTGPLNLATN